VYLAEEAKVRLPVKKEVIQNNIVDQRIRNPFSPLLGDAEKISQLGDEDNILAENNSSNQSARDPSPSRQNQLNTPDNHGVIWNPGSREEQVWSFLDSLNGNWKMTF